MSYYRLFGAKRRHAKTRQMVTCSCFRMATFRPATRKYVWWLNCAMSYYRLFGAKSRKGATRKPAKWWLVRVFAWRPFAPPHESTRHLMRCVFGYCLSYLCLARRKVAMRKPAKITIWRFSRGDLSHFRPENTFIRDGPISHHKFGLLKDGRALGGPIYIPSGDKMVGQHYESNLGHIAKTFISSPTA